MPQDIELAQLRQRMSRRLQELGKSPLKAATDVGLERNFLAEFLNGKKNSFAATKQHLVAQALNWTISDLLNAPRSARNARRGEQPKIEFVPLIDRIAAGALKSPTSQIPLQDAKMLAFSDLGPGEFFALEVEGDSMDRYSPEGSIIVVDKRERRLAPGRCYVFEVAGQVTYKMWPRRETGEPEYLAPHSTNALNKPRFFKKRDLNVIGRVKRTVLDL